MRGIEPEKEKNSQNIRVMEWSVGRTVLGPEFWLSHSLQGMLGVTYLEVLTEVRTERAFSFNGAQRRVRGVN